MRKRYKRKKRACGWCKPYKRGCEPRWKIKQLKELEIAEKEIADFMRVKK